MHQTHYTLLEATALGLWPSLAGGIARVAVGAATMRFALAAPGLSILMKRWIARALRRPAVTAKISKLARVPQGSDRVFERADRCCPEAFLLSLCTRGL
ncbi:hypothetical protein [Bordetella holmesii]|nr:hypothetical protein [Bordetella holmesii]KAK71210.1 hypothetical protein L573_3303 [Bordetella holmesii H620]KAL04623.1 hypothetical protein L499_A1663 [Bordetella holmesii CDC-H635-BH]KCV07404.1 hypothetical protein L498_3348 [Bordetella holmesii CDC-H629-BH]UEB21516.1 hypothetical protein LK440_05445 [Bordetella holmesii]SUV95386.1 Uncharacterised protein [Bordetella holmesii]